MTHGHSAPDATGQTARDGIRNAATRAAQIPAALNEEWRVRRPVGRWPRGRDAELTIRAGVHYTVVQTGGLA